jgi:pyruvate,water dikinase
MDMEWAKDGQTGKLFIVQARPETIHAERDLSKVKEYIRTSSSKELVTMKVNLDGENGLNGLNMILVVN